MSKIGWKATQKQLEALARGRELAHVSKEGNARKRDKMLGKNNWNYGREFSKEHREKIGESGKGRTPWNKGKSWSDYISEEKRKKIIGNLKNKSGDQHWNWKGGVQSIRRPRDTPEYKKWRMSVFRRDNFTCVSCNKVGGKIVGDHIKPWIDYPELRFEVSNGRTLCEPCHKKTDTYGFKIMWARKRLNNKQEQNYELQHLAQ